MRIDWSKWNHLLGEIPDSKLADRISCTGTAVGYQRKKLGIPSWSEKQAQRQAELQKSGLKQCTRCKRIKPLGEFYRCGHASDGLTWQCKDCLIERAAKWQKQYPDRANAKGRQWKHAHPEQVTASQSKWRNDREGSAMNNRLEVAVLVGRIISDAARISDHAKALIAAFAPVDNPLPYTDRIAEMPINRHPSNATFKRNFRGSNVWPRRKASDITGITIHHTMSHSPVATARYCTLSKGYPTIQYHAWISAGDGCPAWLVADPLWALWHDHTGKIQRTLSIGMAGSLHLKPPPAEQMVATARLVAHLMEEYSVPVEQVWGHNERRRRATGKRTDCPGWDNKYGAKPSGEWRNEFFEILKGMLKE